MSVNGIRKARMGEKSESAPTFTQADLKGRGWSPSLIRDVLGEPDRTVADPHHRTGPEMKLWEQSRVIEAEASELFAKKREEAAAQIERDELIAKAESLVVEVISIPMDELMARSPMDAGFGALSDKATKDRWAVNFIRHELCTYDLTVTDLAEKIGARQAVTVVRGKVYQAIAAAYPKLAPECVDQYRNSEPRSLDTWWTDLPDASQKYLRGARLKES